MSKRQLVLLEVEVREDDGEQDAATWDWQALLGLEVKVHWASSPQTDPIEGRLSEFTPYMRVQARAYACVYHEPEVNPDLPWCLTQTPDDTEVERFKTSDQAMIRSFQKYPHLEVRDDDGKLIVPVWYMTSAPDWDAEQSEGQTTGPFFFESWADAQKALVHQMSGLGFSAEELIYPIKAEQLHVASKDGFAAVGIVTIEDPSGWLVGYKQLGYEHRIDFYTVTVQ